MGARTLAQSQKRLERRVEPTEVRLEMGRCVGQQLFGRRQRLATVILSHRRSQDQQRQRIRATYAIAGQVPFGHDPLRFAEQWIAARVEPGYPVEDALDIALSLPPGVVLDPLKALA